MTDIRYAAYGYPMAEQDSSGNWVLQAPDSLSEGEWGTLRIEAGAVWDCTGGTAVLTTAGTDITTVNDVPTLVESLSWGSPYGETTGQISLPELAPFDDPTAIGLIAGGNLDIYRVLPASLAVAYGTAEVPYWHGIVASLEMADGAGMQSSWTAQLTGALYGEASLRAHQPYTLDQSQDVGTWAGRALSPLDYARPLPPYQRFTFEGATTNINVRCRGSRGQSVIDYLDELLALAQDATNGQWTIARAFRTQTGPGGSISVPRPRHYYLASVPQSMGSAIQQNTVFAGGYGIGLSLSKDVTETPTAIYGEGVHPIDSSDLSGSRWRNSKWPMLTTTPPAYPDRVGTASTYPIQSPDDDADFTTDVITQVQSQLRAGGWPDVRITGAWDADTTTGLNALWASLGSAQDSQIASDGDWDLIFGTGTGYTDGSGYFAPLVDANPYYRYAADGDVIGTATGYDPTMLRVDQTLSYGEGIPKSRAIKHATRVVNTGEVEWIGSITLTSDPTDENGTGRSRLDIREGGWVQVNNLSGGTYEQFHISAVTVAPESDGFPVTLTVSQSPYALLDLVTRIERNKAAKSDPARSFYNQRTQVVRPFRSAVGWDAESGAGLIRGFAAAGSAWTVSRIVGSQFGSIASLRVDADPACGYAFAVFGGSVAGTALDALIPNPLAAVGTADGSYPSWWSHPDNQDTLAGWGFIEAWGDSDEYAGYYPGAYSIGTTVAGGSVTGALEDAGPWTFASLEPPFLWVAVWPKTSGTATVSGAMRIVVEE